MCLGEVEIERFKTRARKKQICASFFFLVYSYDYWIQNYPYVECNRWIENVVLTNQDFIKVPIIFRMQQIRKRIHEPLGTSIIRSRKYLLGLMSLFPDKII